MVKPFVELISAHIVITAFVTLPVDIQKQVIGPTTATNMTINLPGLFFSRLISTL